VHAARRLHVKEAVGTKDREEYIHEPLGVPLPKRFDVCALLFRMQINSPNKGVRNTVITIT
jgi:hypothetical protein